MSIGDVVPMPGSGQIELDRTPPQDIAAEQCALGGMLLSKDAIADVVEVLRPTDFYRPAHQVVYDAILELYGRGEPADPVTVAAELTRAGSLERIGGAPYLHTLIASVPTAANAGYYAEIIRERAILRRLIEAGTKVVQLGYGAASGMGGEVDDVVDRAQAAVYEVVERRTSEDYVDLESAMWATYNEIEAIGNRGGELFGVPTGFRDLDELTNGLHDGQLVVIAGRPGMGKSTVGLDILRSASIAHRKAGVVFSLEMGKSEITMRLLSAEARIPLTRIRTGALNDDDWNKLARRMGEVAQAPMFIDDSPNMNMMEIRAKARRLRQRNDLRLIVVDYLQLMTSPKRVENRQQEVAEISRSLKLLAKELSLPVIAISQLNRGAEQRSDKRPQLSDLRECVAGDTLVWRADTGERVPISQLAAMQEIPVWTVDDRLRLRRGVMSEVWRTGVRPAYEVVLASGQRVVATDNHPFRTVRGWRAVGELRVGDHLATARAVPAPSATISWPDHEVILLAHLLGDGCVTRAPIYYCSRDAANRDVVEKAAVDFGVTTRRTPGRGVTYVHFPMAGPSGRGRTNPIYDWLRSLGVMGAAAPDKRVPESIQRLDDKQVSLFLRHLWATDGSVTTRPSGRVRIYYGTTSRGLADDVAALLLRLGIGARVRRATPPVNRAHRQGWTVDVSGREDQQVFLKTVGVHGERGERCAEALAALGDASLADLATSHVRWERIVSIEPAGDVEVFDARVPGTHSFLANAIVSHNSGAIEQDADVVILLHRDDAYERESPRAGEADLIVAKHRNGPTKDVVVSSQLHYSRFVDMPHS